MIRDNEIYPFLREWGSRVKDGLIVEIGSGQGVCSDHLGGFVGRYIGVEPSEALLTRSRELYGEGSNRSFVSGSAYNIPINDCSAGAVFSVTVWFHLADLNGAACELSRILKEGGKFSIITTNPDSYHVWETMYQNTNEEGKLLVGRARVPINPLSRNTLYRHTLHEMVMSLLDSGLTIESADSNLFGILPDHPKSPLFINIRGTK